MSKDKLKLSTFIFLLSGWAMSQGASTTLYIIFGLTIAIWLAALFRRAHPNLFTEVQNPPGVPGPGPKQKR